ncbi:MAG: CRR6 family NdhI maturation factor, partial [Phormidesmis sp.]
MKHAITLNPLHFQSLNLTPAKQIIDPVLASHPEDQALSNPELTFSFDIDFPREDSDPRELSEIPEVRLWFIRLNARYPWLPLYLDWESGELSRYTAMLVPHQFSPI